MTDVAIVLDVLGKKDQAVSMTKKVIECIDPILRRPKKAPHPCPPPINNTAVCVRSQMDMYYDEQFGGMITNWFNRFADHYCQCDKAGGPYACRGFNHCDNPRGWSALGNYGNTMIEIVPEVNNSEQLAYLANSISARFPALSIIPQRLTGSCAHFNTNNEQSLGIFYQVELMDYWCNKGGEKWYDPLTGKGRELLTQVISALQPNQRIHVVDALFDDMPPSQNCSLHITADRCDIPLSLVGVTVKMRSRIFNIELSNGVTLEFSTNDTQHPTLVNVDNDSMSFPCSGMPKIFLNNERVYNIDGAPASAHPYVDFFSRSSGGSLMIHLQGNINAVLPLFRGRTYERTTTLSSPSLAKPSLGTPLFPSPKEGCFPIINVSPLGVQCPCREDGTPANTTSSSARIISRFGAANFILLHFRDENGDGVVNEEGFRRRIFGFLSGDPRYMEELERYNASTFTTFVAMNSNSTGAYMTCIAEVTLHEYLGELGSLPIAKQLKRRRQLLTGGTDTHIQVKLLDSVLPDERAQESLGMGTDDTFTTDGCGVINRACLDQLQAKLKGNASTIFQVRVGGVKGVVTHWDTVYGRYNAVETSATGEPSLWSRPSMNKFKFPDRSLLIVDVAKPSKLSLCRPLAILLNACGVSELVFRELQESFSKELLANRAPLTLNKGMQIGLRESDVRRLRRAPPVPMAAALVGVCDESRELQSNEVYLSDGTVSQMASLGIDVTTLCDGMDVIVARRPVYLAHHLLKVTLRIGKACPSINHVVGGIVFPAGDHIVESLPAKMGGGDLDGDRYQIIWNPKLTTPFKQDPWKELPFVNKEGALQMTLIEYASWTTSLQANLKRFATWFVQSCGRLGYRAKESQELGELCCIEVDAADSGYFIDHSREDLRPKPIPLFLGKSAETQLLCQRDEDFLFSPLGDQASDSFLYFLWSTPLMHFDVWDPWGNERHPPSLTDAGYVNLRKNASETNTVESWERFFLQCLYTDEHRPDITDLWNLRWTRLHSPKYHRRMAGMFFFPEGTVTLHDKISWKPTVRTQSLVMKVRGSKAVPERAVFHTSSAIVRAASQSLSLKQHLRDVFSDAIPLAFAPQYSQPALHIKIGSDCFLFRVSKHRKPSTIEDYFNMYDAQRKSAAKLGDYLDATTSPPKGRKEQPGAASGTRRFFSDFSRKFITGSPGRSATKSADEIAAHLKVALRPIDSTDDQHLTVFLSKHNLHWSLSERFRVSVPVDVNQPETPITVTSVQPLVETLMQGHVLREGVADAEEVNTIRMEVEAHLADVRQTVSFISSVADCTITLTDQSKNSGWFCNYVRRMRNIALLGCRTPRGGVPLSFDIVLREGVERPSFTKASQRVILQPSIHIPLQHKKKPCDVWP